MEDELYKRISRNFDTINEKIENACIKAGRKREDVKLVVVTKTVGADEVRAAYQYGQRDFAENRVQKLMEKFETLPEITDANWHLIGSLQTNKVKYCADKVVLIHSLDRIALADELNKFGVKHDMTVHALLELNISGEESKQGMDPKDIDEFLEHFSGLTNVALDGVMTMAPFGEKEENLRKIFASARKFAVDIQSKNVHNIDMSQLSMGMSGDFESAILEGATIVRIGTAAFVQ